MDFDFGIDLDALEAPADMPVYPDVVPGRTVHIDADFIAYIAAADTRAELDGKKPMRTIDQKQAQVIDIAEEVARKSGAERYALHITPSGSNKGGRADQAVAQEYQANRQGRDAPEDLHAIRAYIGGLPGSVVHLDQEADDGLAQVGYSSDIDVIASADKDLRMVPGWHLFGDDLVYRSRDDFGEFYVDYNGKPQGYGPKWFFAQLLMGDTADNIKGLPIVHGSVASKLKPTKKLLAALEAPEKASSQREIQDALTKHKPCGPKMAVDLLNRVDNIRDAYRLVKKLYVLAADVQPFTHWRTGRELPGTVALAGEMQLLWMRRSKDPKDVFKWLRENV